MSPAESVETSSGVWSSHFSRSECWSWRAWVSSWARTGFCSSMLDPVEHVDGFGFGVVEGLDLLLEQRQQKGLEVEVAVEEAELLEDDFVALEAFCAPVVVEFLLEVAFDGGAGGELALDGALDGQTGLVGGELDEFVDEGEKLLGLLGGDVGCGLGLVGSLGAGGWRPAGRRGWTGRRQVAAPRPQQPEDRGLLSDPSESGRFGLACAATGACWLTCQVISLWLCRLDLNLARLRIRPGFGGLPAAPHTHTRL